MISLWLVLGLFAGPMEDYAAAIALSVDRPAEAVGALTRIADRWPEDPLAAEALWDAARLHADRLDRPDEARRTLEALVARWPEARPARRAQAELAAMAAIADDERAALRSGEPGALRALVERGGGPGARARLRLAEDAEAEAAEALLAPLLEDPRWAWRAQRTLGRKMQSAGRFLAALRAYQEAGDQSGTWRATKSLTREWTATAGGVLVVLWVLVATARGLRAGTLWPPGRRVVAAALACALLGAAAMGSWPEQRGVLALLAVGGAGLSWIGLRAPARGPVARAVALVVVLVAFLWSVLYHLGGAALRA